MPSIVCWQLFSLPREPQACLRYSAFKWKEYFVFRFGMTSHLYLAAVKTLKCLLEWDLNIFADELPLGMQSLPIKSCCLSLGVYVTMSTPHAGFVPPPETSISKRKLHSSKIWWVLVFTHGSLSACSLYDCLSKASCFLFFLEPCICFPFLKCNCI